MMRAALRNIEPRTLNVERRTTAVSAYALVRGSTFDVQRSMFVSAR